MAAGKINLQANDTRIYEITAEDGAGGNVAITLPKEGGMLTVDAEAVHKTGDETIAGVKTFSSSPIVPTPTTDMQVCTKQYADGKVSKSGDTMTGNLNFSGIGLRITGDFSSPAHSNRTAFQTNVPNSATSPFIIPSGTGRIAQIVTGGISDASNTPFISMASNSLSKQNIINSSFTGTGELYPILFNLANAERLRIDTSGNVLVTGSGGLGYGNGSGGTVTQLTSKSTAVTLNKPCGQITMNNAALAAGSQVIFNMFNSLVTSKDTCTVSINGGTSNGGFYRARSACQDGFSQIYVENITGGSLSEALVIQFNIIKGANA